jgi:hypothetical protein
LFLRWGVAHDGANRPGERSEVAICRVAPPERRAQDEEGLGIHDQARAVVTGDDVVEELGVTVNAQALVIMWRPGTTDSVDVDATSLAS